MTQTLAEIAAHVGGELHGEGATEISGPAILRDAEPGEITFVDRAELAKKLTQCQATAAIVPLDFQPEGIPYIAVKEVHAAFAQVVRLFHPPSQTSFTGIDATARISSTAELGEEVNIGPGVVIGDHVVLGDRCTIHAGVSILAGTQIGEETTIFPGAVIYEDCRIGPRCIIHANAVVGAYGFGYDSTAAGHILSEQLGSVQIGSDVEIGACATIDRGTYTPTVVGQGTKIDNQVMVAHNCRIGKHNLLCSQVGIAGSTTTGDYVVMGGQVGVRDHVAIGDRAMLGAMSGVIHDIPADSREWGIPCTEEREQMVRLASIRKLPKMRQEFKQMRNQLAELEKQIEAISATASPDTQSNDPNSRTEAA